MDIKYCEWCEKRRDTIMIFVEAGMDEYCVLCRPCAIAYYEEEIYKLKFEENIDKLATLNINYLLSGSPESPYKAPRLGDEQKSKTPKAIKGTHCF